MITHYCGGLVFCLFVMYTFANRCLLHPVTDSRSPRGRARRGGAGGGGDFYDIVRTRGCFRRESSRLIGFGRGCRGGLLGSTRRVLAVIMYVASFPLPVAVSPQVDVVMQPAQSIVVAGVFERLRCAFMGRDRV